MKQSGVYLLKVPYDGTSLLKIGFSSNVPKRIKTHLSSNPLIEVIGFIETDDYKSLEKEIHKKCAKYKFKTEWFLNKEIIIDYFKKHPTFTILN